VINDRPQLASVEPGQRADPASRRVADHLRRQILNGAIQPGEWIRQEDVADMFELSRLPVREALRILAAEGLTELHPNKGARVPKLSMHEVDVVYRMRESLEPLALSESVPNLDDAAIADLRDIQSDIESNNDLRRFLELDRAFHLFSYSGCVIEPLSSTVVRLWNTTTPYRRAFVALSGPGRSWIINAEHNLLIDAIERRDIIDAENVLRSHIRRTRTELATHPEVFEN
jgi:DNA-binding GntR family transcriptional regulator